MVEYDVVTIERQHELAKEFLSDVCCMGEDEVNANYRKVELDNNWNCNPDEKGYYELSVDVCVVNADSFF